MSIPGRCEHGLNRQCCLKCWHAPKAAKPRETEPVLGFGGIPLGRMPGTVQVKVGDRTGAHIGEAISGHPPVDPGEKARHRGEDRRPPQSGNEAAQPPAPRAAYSSADAGQQYDADGLWTPAARPEIIDRLPQHPEAMGRR